MTRTAAFAAPEAAPAAEPSLKRDHFALVIGIQNYREFEPLDAPNRDAASFFRWLTDVAKLPPENIQPVLGESDGTPTNSDILNAFDRLELRMRRWRGSRLYIYFAGHGVGPQVNEVAMLPGDARVDALNQQVFGAAAIIDHLFKRHFFSEIAMFLDCCREAQALTPLGLPYTPVDVVDGAYGKPPPSYYVMVGSNMDGQSFEICQERPRADAAKNSRGLMTEALMEGLHGAYGAVDPVLNAVTTTSLEHYVALKVAERAKDKGLSQQVTPLIKEGGPIVLLQLQSVPQVTLRITIGPQSAGNPIRIRNLRTNTWQVVGTGPASTRLADILLDTNTRHVLTDGHQVMELLDPVTMSNPHVIDLA